MGILESLHLTRKKPEPELWTFEQGLEKLELLNGQAVNMSSVLKKHRPQHVHYRKVQSVIEVYAKRHNLPENTWGIGDYVIERDSQRLITDLLAARV